MRHASALCLCLCLSLAGCGDPKDAAGWAKRAVSRSRLDEKTQALAQVRRASGDRRPAVPYLVELLRADQPARARGEAALALGEIGDPAAVKPLLQAVDPGAKDRDGIEANRQVAAALGALRAREAVPVLVELTRSPDGFTQVAAVDALGQIGDPAAVDTLVAIATDDRSEPFTAKKALLALGRIADPRAAPAVLRMAFQERPGVSFYPEAAFATSQIGPPMAAPLVAVLEGRDGTLQGWARDHGVVTGALYAKAAQLLGDVGGPGAVPPLVQKLSYRDGDAGLELFVRVYAAESLGRMRAREAVRPLGELLGRERNADARDRYCEALVRIGDAGAIPALRAAAAGGRFADREAALVALSRLGGEAERPLLEAARAKDCGPGCPDATRRSLDGMSARLDAAKACGDVACWARKLSDASAAVRDRAALEVGRAGGARDAVALGDAIVRPVTSDDDLAARYHAVLGLTWLSARAPVGVAGGPIASAIDGMIVAEKGRTLTAAVNEDALRLATKLRRSAQGR